MSHWDVITKIDTKISNEFKIRITGRYYTPNNVASYIFSILIPQLKQMDFYQNKVTIVDPFAGDGRLVIWLIEAWQSLRLPDIHWDIYLFDLDGNSLELASINLDKLKRQGVRLSYKATIEDTFKLPEFYNNKFDIVITNPPWELLKPDSRELYEFNKEDKDNYIATMKTYDNYLKEKYPLSQPLKKFAGWGTNLSRVGAELSFKFCKNNGYLAIVLPASFFADEQSMHIRKELLSKSIIYDIAYYPAEAKLFGKADVSSSSLVLKKVDSGADNIQVSIFDKFFKIKSSDIISYQSMKLDDNHLIPITLGGKAITLFEKMKKKLPNWKELENSDGLWAGREIDETGSQSWLSLSGNGPKFIKGKMIDRFRIIEKPYQYISKDDWNPQNSCKFDRIAWRDVSRPSQKRRVVATIIPQDTVAGNSLNVAYFKDGDKKALISLLAIMNSLCFEFQLRCYLATGHISLSAIRKVHLPAKKALMNLQSLIEAVQECLNQNLAFSAKIEAIVAKEVYGLSLDELNLLLDTFDKCTLQEKNDVLTEFNNITIEHNEK
ncbi:Alw26I/Eco31I/Esp3I family type II restriction adenine-specific DNA-methyltransferase [Legionella pneumophila serogroup 1]